MAFCQGRNIFNWRPCDCGGCGGGGTGFTGPAGPIGPIGPTGPSEGPTGPVGPTGASGYPDGFLMFLGNFYSITTMETFILFNTDQTTGGEFIGYNDGSYNPATGIYTVPSTGIYQLNANIGFEWNFNNQLRTITINIYVNSTVGLRTLNLYNGNDAVNYNISSNLFLTAGDEINVSLIVDTVQTSFQNLTRIPTTYFGMHRIA